MDSKSFPSLFAKYLYLLNTLEDSWFLNQCWFPKGGSRESRGAHYIPILTQDKISSTGNTEIKFSPGKVNV